MLNLIEKKKTVTTLCIVLFFCVALMTVNTSCKHQNQYPKETAILDSIVKAIQSTDSLLSKTDTLSIKKRVDHVVVTLDYVKILNKDTVSHSAAEILRTFNATRW